MELHFTKIGDKAYTFRIKGGLIKNNDMELFEMTSCHVKMARLEFLDHLNVQQLHNIDEDSDHYRKAVQLYQESPLPCRIELTGI